MKVPNLQTFRLIVVVSLTLALLSATGVGSLAQSLSQRSAPASQFNDLARVVDEATKRKLETLLSNLKQRTGINLTVATVQTTAGQNIFEFSRQLAGVWDTGARTSASKSLLLVVAVNEKAFFTQFSKTAQDTLPEGTLGEMGQRMRVAIGAGRFSEGLLLGIQSFVRAVGQNVGDTRKQPQAQGSGSTKDAAESSSPSREPSRKTAGSSDAYRSGVVPGEPRKLDQSVLSMKESSEITGIVPKSSAASKENPTLLEAPRNEGSPSPPAADSASLAPSSSSPNAAPPYELALTGIYKVGVGDMLDIRLLNSTSHRSTLYTVIEGGFIDLPIAGAPLLVAGLTTEQIQALIASELKRRAIEEGVQVSVGVRQYASHSVIITGLVSTPGTKLLRREAVPLYVVLAEAQPRMDAGRVTIMRAGASGQAVDLGDSAALNFIVLPGDVINVTARPQQFYYVGGRITYPGQKTFQPDITLLQAIIAAGGPARQGDYLVELSREGADGRLTMTKFSLKEIKFGKIQDPKLQSGDRIEIVH